MRRTARSILVGAALLSLCGSIGLAGAAERGSMARLVEQPAPATSAKAEILILHATNDGKGIDPNIGKIPELTEPPLSSYNSYKLVERADLELVKGQAKEKKLPDGGKLGLTLKEITKGKKKDEPTKYAITTTLEKADGKPFIPSMEMNAQHGKYFFLAGPKHQGGILVIGIKVK